MTKTWREELDEIARDTARMGGGVSMFLDRINDGYELEVYNDEASEEELTEIYRDAWLERKKFFEQREATGARSNIEEAFDDLESKGVLARACFSCCGTCASSEIWGEFDESRPWQGYVYFHWQDAEALVDTDGTYLGYGWYVPSKYPTPESWEALPEAEQQRIYETEGAKVIHDIVIPTLTSHGLTARWDGDWNKRIFVTGVTNYVMPLSDFDD